MKWETDVAFPGKSCSKGFAAQRSRDDPAPGPPQPAQTFLAGPPQPSTPLLPRFCFWLVLVLVFVAFVESLATMVQTGNVSHIDT